MDTLLQTILSITPGQIAMMLIGGVLMYLGIKKNYEPTLLVPMGLGTILVNFPNSGVLTQVIGGSKAEGILDVLFKAGINTELFPLL
ncbi:sodium ion-translocating decarboxylase subunit beta, partial [Lacticaseibacillus baoqingensis]